MLCKGCSAGVLIFFPRAKCFSMFPWVCVWHDMKSGFQIHITGKTFVTTFWQLLQHMKPIPNYPVYNILTVPCKNMNICMCFPPFLNFGWDDIYYKPECMSCFWNSLVNAENVWETVPMVMDLNLFDSFLLTVFKWTSPLIMLCCTVVNANPLAPTYPIMYWVDEDETQRVNPQR